MRDLVLKFIDQHCESETGPSAWPALSRLLVACFVVLAFVAQTQVTVGHFHSLAPVENASGAHSPTDDRSPAEPRNEQQCFYCHQFAGSQHFLVASAFDSLEPPLAEHVVAPVVWLQPDSKPTSFDWLSRAPPIA